MTLGYWASNALAVSEFTLTVYSRSGSKSEPKGTTLSTIG